MSSTVDKALQLLGLFGRERPELGLSEAARLAAIDKATAHRMFGALARHGLVEQHARSRLYRLGAGVLRLARNREASFPVAALVAPVVDELAAASGETAHASMLDGESLSTIALAPGRKSIHVALDPGESLPLHATASGIACLAFMAEEEAEARLRRGLKPFTGRTATRRDEVMKAVRLARARGYATADQTYESDVYGVAAPLFGAGGAANGAIAIATPAHRMSREVKARTIRQVLDAAAAVAARLGVEPPPAFLALSRKSAA